MSRGVAATRLSGALWLPGVAGLPEDAGLSGRTTNPGATAAGLPGTASATGPGLSGRTTNPGATAGLPGIAETSATGPGLSGRTTNPGATAGLPGTAETSATGPGLPGTVLSWLPVETNCSGAKFVGLLRGIGVIGLLGAASDDVAGLGVAI